MHVPKYMYLFIYFSFLPPTCIFDHWIHVWIIMVHFFLSSGFFNRVILSPELNWFMNFIILKNEIHGVKLLVTWKCWLCQCEPCSNKDVNLLIILFTFFQLSKFSRVNLYFVKKMPWQGWEDLPYVLWQISCLPKAL